MTVILYLDTCTTIFTWHYHSTHRKIKIFSHTCTIVIEFTAEKQQNPAPNPIDNVMVLMGIVLLLMETIIVSTGMMDSIGGMLSDRWEPVEYCSTLGKMPKTHFLMVLMEKS